MLVRDILLTVSALCFLLREVWMKILVTFIRKCKIERVHHLDILSSTEIFEVEVSRYWREVAALPMRLNGLRAATVNNKIYLTGILAHCQSRNRIIRDDIYCSNHKEGGMRMRPNMLRSTCLKIKAGD